MRGHFEIQPVIVRLDFKKYAIEGYYSDEHGIKDIEAYRIMVSNGCRTKVRVTGKGLKLQIMKRWGAYEKLQ